MKFEEALKAMKAGSKAKLPSWGGYWYWSPEKETIIMHTKDGQELDIRETQSVVYTLQNILSDEWIIADEVNCPQLGGEATFSFGEAIKYLKRGSKVARKGWNGKGMFIFMRPEDSLPTNMIVNQVKSLPESFKRWVANNHGYSETDRIKFTAYLCMKAADGTVVNGWLASQTDMLANDWMIVK